MRSVLLAFASLTLLGLAGCGSGSDAESTPAAAGGGGKQIALSAQEFSFDPGTIQIDQPGTYTFTLTNDGGLQHALEIEGQGVEEEMDTVAPGNTGQLTITFSKTGSYEFYCPVDGHRGQGMEGTLTIGAASGGTGTSMENEGGGSTDTGKSGGGYGYGEAAETTRRARSRVASAFRAPCPMPTTAWTVIPCSTKDTFQPSNPKPQDWKRRAPSSSSNVAGRDGVPAVGMRP